ncbi:GTPase HflX [Candidatus Babeliales bacterium]|nr:GTPase HflX [Candidatus Babeliales bacterium]
MARPATPTDSMRPRILIVGIYAPYNRLKSAEHYYDEFLSLIETLGLKYDESMFLKLRNTDKNTFFTKGKLQEVADFCNEHKIEEVIISEVLTPLQERNLEDFFNCVVYDRTKLILEIFRNAAISSESKVQIEMAEIEFLKTRVFGKGVHLAQQAGYIGGKGPGETLAEVAKQEFGEKLRQAQKKLDTLQRARDTQRKQRLESKIPLVCLIGYTNAGKSSLINRLTKSDVLAEDKLFATLDTTTRELYLGKDKNILVSDTVGFISELPPKLIEAFKSTLDELRFAALLVQVIDASNPAWPDHLKVVHQILEDLGVQDKPMIYAFNKVDKLSDEEVEKLKHDVEQINPHVLINTRSKEGVADLVAFMIAHNFKA